MTSSRELDRVGLCVCGVSVSLHFDDGNRKLTCAAAHARLVRASTRRTVLRRLPRRAARDTARVLPFPPQVTVWA